MSYIIYALPHFTSLGRYELNKVTSIPLRYVISQLAERHTGISPSSQTFRWQKVFLICDSETDHVFSA